MNEAEKKIAEELLKDITAVNASLRLEDYKTLLQCVKMRQHIEGFSSINRASECMTATGHAAIDNT